MDIQPEGLPKCTGNDEFDDEFELGSTRYEYDGMFFIFSCHVTSCDKHNEYVHEIELLGRSRSATTCMSQKPSSHAL